jgi:hypothetical protein
MSIKAEGRQYRKKRRMRRKKRMMRRGDSNSKLNTKQEAKYFESITCHDNESTFAARKRRPEAALRKATQSFATIPPNSKQAQMKRRICLGPAHRNDQQDTSVPVLL